MQRSDKEETLLRTLLVYLCLYLLRWLRWTYRFRYAGSENLRLARKYRPDHAVCFATWHENAIADLLGAPEIPLSLLASRSKDGDFASTLVHGIGYETVRGSSSQGGTEARHRLATCLEEGTSIGITLDGPRGPRHHAKPGILALSAKGDAMIVPIITIPERYWTLRSWDKTKIPVPFTTIVYQFGTPFLAQSIPQSDNEHSGVEHLSDALEATERAAETSLRDWAQLPNTWQ